MKTQSLSLIVATLITMPSLASAQQSTLSVADTTQQTHLGVTRAEVRADLA
jgi:hypothetical protein